MSNQTYQFLSNLSKILELKECKEVVLSPGSRNAPIALSLMRNKQLKIHIVNDERSAAYFALGRALSTDLPVVLVCTSGTATVNYYPAVTEAYYQRIPLFVITADRPHEYYHQNHNQVINQRNLYRNHIEKYYSIDLTLINDRKRRNYFLKVNELLNTASHERRPVHLNIHLDDKLYPEKPFSPADEPIVNITMESPAPKLSARDFNRVMQDLMKYKKILIIGGQYRFNPKLRKLINKLLTLTDITFIRDITTNIHGLERAIMHPEEVIEKVQNMESLQPDMVISFGHKLSSKKIVEFLREYPPQAHWHVSEYDDYFDNYESLTKLVKTNVEEFFRSLLRSIKLFEGRKFQAYYLSWQKLDDKLHPGLISSYDQDPELSYFRAILEDLPKNSCLHLGNSQSIRQANHVNLFENKQARSIEVLSNRGSSGIDGSLSTAIGAALNDKRKHFIILGDQSFVYDRNALWNKKLPENLVIIIINNKGGKIFSKIDGPRRQPEYKEFFVSHVPFDFEKEALQFGIFYQKVSEVSEIKSIFRETKRMDRLSMIEIQISDDTI